MLWILHDNLVDFFIRVVIKNSMIFYKFRRFFISCICLKIVQFLRKSLYKKFVIFFIAQSMRIKVNYRVVESSCEWEKIIIHLEWARMKKSLFVFPFPHSLTFIFWLSLNNYRSELSYASCMKLMKNCIHFSSFDMLNTTTMEKIRRHLK